VQAIAEALGAYSRCFELQRQQLACADMWLQWIAVQAVAEALAAYSRLCSLRDRLEIRQRLTCADMGCNGLLCRLLLRRWLRTAG
jgi:hypothetical protein